MSYLRVTGYVVPSGDLHARLTPSSSMYVQYITLCTLVYNQYTSSQASDDADASFRFSFSFPKLL